MTAAGQVLLVFGKEELPLYQPWNSRNNFSLCPWCWSRYNPDYRFREEAEKENPILMGIFEKIGALFGGSEKAGPAGKLQRNDPCWCGSGKKYKKCHLPADDKKTASSCSLSCGPT
jgi:hypothetical protein